MTASPQTPTGTGDTTPRREPRMDRGADHYIETFRVMQEPFEDGDEVCDGLSALTALEAVANFADDDWCRCLRPDLHCHPMGAYEFIACAVVLALASEPGMLGPAAAALVAEAESRKGYWT